MEPRAPTAVMMDVCHPVDAVLPDSAMSFMRAADLPCGKLAALRAPHYARLLTASRALVLPWSTCCGMQTGREEDLAQVQTRQMRSMLLAFRAVLGRSSTVGAAALLAMCTRASHLSHSIIS